MGSQPDRNIGGGGETVVEPLGAWLRNQQRVAAPCSGPLICPQGRLAIPGAFPFLSRRASDSYPGAAAEAAAAERVEARHWAGVAEEAVPFAAEEVRGEAGPVAAARAVPRAFAEAEPVVEAVPDDRFGDWAAAWVVGTSAGPGSGSAAE